MQSVRAHQGELNDAIHTQKEQQRAQLVQRFYLMDQDHDGRVSKKEFSIYLERNPAGWPLGDILQNQTKEQQSLILQFWFRKLDIAGLGYITLDEFLAFFNAMSTVDYRESLLTDYLLNLFDENMDGSLDRKEYVNMLTVLLGRAPPATLVNDVYKRADSNHDGKLSRAELRDLLHRVHCDIGVLAGHKGSSALIDGLVFVAGAAAVVLVGVVLFRFYRQKL